MPDHDCIFCKIASGDVPGAIVFENDHVVAFLDINPLAPGHCLLVPRDHHARIWDLPSETAVALASVLPSLASAVREASGATDLNILQNNGPSSGQVVEHIHFHLIPRREGDGLGFRWAAGAYPIGGLLSMLAAVRRALGN